MSYVNVGGVWKSGTDYVNVNGVWKQNDSQYVNINGVWKQVKKDASQLFYVGYSSGSSWNTTVNPIEVISDGTTSNLQIKLYLTYSGGGDIWLTFVPPYNPNSVLSRMNLDFLLTPYIASKISDLSVQIGRGYSVRSTEGGFGSVICNASIATTYSSLTNGTAKNMYYSSTYNTDLVTSPIIIVENNTSSTNWASTDYLLIEFYDVYFGSQIWHTKK